MGNPKPTELVWVGERNDERLLWGLVLAGTRARWHRVQPVAVRAYQVHRDGSGQPWTARNFKLVRNGGVKR